MTRPRLARLLDRLAAWLSADYRRVDPDVVVAYIEREADRR